MMPAYNAVACFLDVVISVGIVLALYALLGKSLRELLDKTIRLSAGSIFYMRALILVLFCTALSKVLNGVHQKPEAHFIEYVWQWQAIFPMCLTIYLEFYWPMWRSSRFWLLY
jgi:hypothetical protein